MEAADRTFDDIKIGEKITFDKVWTDDDVRVFSVLSGDNNPLHMNSSYAEKTEFGERIVHGMLLASSFSKIVGMYIPGKRCLFLKQNISFKNPVHINEPLEIVGEVTQKVDSMKMIVIRTTINSKKGETTVVEGEATVQVLHAYNE